MKNCVHCFLWTAKTVLSHSLTIISNLCEDMLQLSLTTTRVGQDYSCRIEDLVYSNVDHVLRAVICHSWWCVGSGTLHQGGPILNSKVRFCPSGVRSPDPGWRKPMLQAGAQRKLPDSKLALRNIYKYSTICAKQVDHMSQLPRTWND